MLILRKGTQPLLDAIGLEDLHTEIKNNFLVLVGTCGKQLVSIQGISFSGKPTVVEREYATELFAQFLAKHGDDLRAFVTASKEFSVIEPPVVPSGMRQSVYGTVKVCQITLPIGIATNNDGRTTMNMGKDFAVFTHAFILDKLQEVIDTYQAPVRAYLEALEAYEAQSDAINKARSKIQTCSI